MADPFEWINISNNECDSLSSLKSRLAHFAQPGEAGLPPFQGGAAGLFAYDLGHSLERIPRAHDDEFGLPAMAVGLYDVVLAWDHSNHQAWIISQGWPETNASARYERANRRLDWFRTLIRTAKQDSTIPNPPLRNDRHVPADSLAAQYPTHIHNKLTSNFSREGYLRSVQRIVEYIRAGDVFQVNLSQRLLVPAMGDSVDLYLRLRQTNPATFAGYVDTGKFQIVSASPERFLSIRGNWVEARPIKGTRQRMQRAEADLYAAEELLASEKDRSENVMIVDLLRNDLSRVCQPDSVCVTQLCKLEVYEHVQHLVSAIIGRLLPDRQAIDALRVSFPGGSITGAPKVRAMEIVAELEPTARGAYCGCMGYIGFDGTMDTNILIRTVTSGRGWWQAPVGGGIVVKSDPEQEYAETWLKAEGILQAILEQGAYT